MQCELCEWCVRVVCECSVRQVKEMEYIWKVQELVCAELLSRCEDCNGVGHKYAEAGNTVPCRRCAATGHISLDTKFSKRLELAYAMKNRLDDSYDSR